MDIKPDIIFTHSYEGGHPDHDTTSFVVNKAAKTIGIKNIYEFSSYHDDEGRLKCGDFLNTKNDVTEISLTETERILKRKMLAAFITQQETLKVFDVQREIFRPVPEYNYNEPPYEGKLFYENFDWGITGKKWRKLASECF